MTDMTSLQSELLRKSEIDFRLLDEEDLSPDEWEYYNKRSLREEKKRVRRSAMGVSGNRMCGKWREDTVCKVRDECGVYAIR